MATVEAQTIPTQPDPPRETRQDMVGARLEWLEGEVADWEARSNTQAVELATAKQRFADLESEVAEYAGRVDELAEQAETYRQMLERVLTALDASKRAGGGLYAGTQELDTIHKILASRRRVVFT